MRVADLMIVGAGRSGTSSLLRYLGEHPAVRAQQTPEMTWFSDPEGVPADPAILVPRYWGVPPDDALLRIGKAAGLMYEPDGLDRLREVSPEVSLAVILREPVQRTYSGYWFGRARGLEPLESFEEAVWADPARFDGSPTGRTLAYLDWSVYAKHLANLYDRFGRERVHVLFLEEFEASPRHATAELAAALGIDPATMGDQPRRDNTAIRARAGQAARLRKRKRGVRRLVPAPVRRAARLAYRRVNETEAALPPIDERVEADLRDWFSEHNRQLEELLGRPLPSSWSTTSRR